jgi:hypothetical protein
MEIINFNYKNIETNISSTGKKIIRIVSIKNGKGYKSITTYNKNGTKKIVKKEIHPTHVDLIKNRKFIPKLFSDCIATKKC